MSLKQFCEHFVAKGIVCISCDKPDAVVWPCLICDAGTWHEANKCLRCGEEIK